MKTHNATISTEKSEAAPPADNKLFISLFTVALQGVASQFEQRDQCDQSIYADCDDERAQELVNRAYQLAWHSIELLERQRIVATFNRKVGIE
jgi:hypothetical protein